jgi:hypothetical protein
MARSARPRLVGRLGRRDGPSARGTGRVGPRLLRGHHGGAGACRAPVQPPGYCWRTLERESKGRERIGDRGEKGGDGWLGRSMRARAVRV